ncbi:Aldo/keto reductase [Polyplosphaeria fusca]|uniref:Aldo/keto reductase n=1 Tax=Polyplosphaeria fusca TaxID=682080 RepID=A0A9P4V1R1_9PLEO|nr:Aldo/keto reductase [Polyplosphaeria fusca]
MTIKTVFGGASLNPNAEISSPEKLEEALKVFKKAGVNNIDTARLYQGSEEMIGKAAGHEDFIIDSKILGGFSPGTTKKELLIADTQDSLDKCKIPQFDILYIHAPDAEVPFEEMVEAVNEVHKKGLIKRFGLSNFSAEEVQRVYDIAKANGYLLPSVYQGNYSPVARKAETLLFPTLRKLGFVFYAYSPLAGGFLTKTKEQIEQGAGRFNDTAVGGMYNRLYNRPSYVEALAVWNEVAEKEGVSKGELAYRWVGYNSALKEELGDAVIFGASKFAQVEQTAEWLKKGPLSEEAARGIERVWASVEKEAPLDNWEVAGKK